MWVDDFSAYEVYFDDGTSGHYDDIWLATGSDVDVNTDPLLSKLLARRPIDVIGGLPALTPSLKWGDASTEVYVLGALAGLQLDLTLKISPVAAPALSGLNSACETS